MLRTAIAVILTATVTVPLTTLAQQESPCAWVSWIKWHSDSFPAEQWEALDDGLTRLVEWRKTFAPRSNEAVERWLFLRS